MAGHTARRSRLESVGVVVEILQNVPHPCITIVGVGVIIKCLPSILFSVPLSFQTGNIPHSHPGFLPDAPTALKSYDISTSFCNLRLFAELCSIQYLSIRIHEYFCMLIRLSLIVKVVVSKNLYSCFDRLSDIVLYLT